MDLQWASAVLFHRVEEDRYVVIQLVGGTGPCKIVPVNAIIPMIYTVVYGPATHKECLAWKATNFP